MPRVWWFAGHSQTFHSSVVGYWPPLWSSAQSSWQQIRRPGFDSRHYQKKKVVGLERGPLSLVSTNEELLDRKVAAPVHKIKNTDVGIRHADHVAPSIRKNWQSLRRQAAVARSIEFARGLGPWSLFSFVCGGVLHYTLLSAFHDALNGRFNATPGMLLSKPHGTCPCSSYR
jgi:hypothetical protein